MHYQAQMFKEHLNNNATTLFRETLESDIIKGHELIDNIHDMTQKNTSDFVNQDCFKNIDECSVDNNIKNIPHVFNAPTIQGFFKISDRSSNMPQHSQQPTGFVSPLIFSTTYDDNDNILHYKDLCTAFNTTSEFNIDSVHHKIENKVINPLDEKKKKANFLAKKYFSEAKKLIGQKEEFYSSLEKALHNFMKSKLKWQSMYPRMLMEFLSDC